jgi:undecaprenyl-diphosphatase
MSDEGLLKVEGRRVSLLNIPALEELAGMMKTGRAGFPSIRTRPDMGRAVRACCSRVWQGRRGLRPAGTGMGVHGRLSSTHGHSPGAVLGVVEGLTEYLPVSSTGHLYLATRLLGIGGTPGAAAASNAYVIAIQIGAILAVNWLYPQRIASMLRGCLGLDRHGLALAQGIMIAFFPAAVIGLIFGEAVKERLFGIWPITWAWLLGGIAILLVSRWVHGHSGRGGDLGGLTFGGAFVIGMLQCIAMWPGVSRSLVTILGGVLVGLSVQAAVEFSFLLGLVTLGAATCYEILREGRP